MKLLKLLALAATASILLASCSKDGGISVTNSSGQSISSFCPGSDGGTSDDWTVRTADGSDWSVATSGIPGMSASPASGRTNFYFSVTVPENTGPARTGYVTISGGKSSKTITVNQEGK